MAGLYDLLIQNAATQSRTAPPAPSIKDTTEPAPPMTAEEVDLATQGETALGSNAGVSQVKGMVKGALAATAEVLSAPRFGQSIRESANADMAEAQRISSYSSAPQSLKNVGGVGDFLDYARFGVAKQAPQLGAMAGAALVGGGAGVAAMGVGMNAGAQYLDGNAEVDELRAQNLITPERESQLRTQVLEKSGVAGVIMGALDRIGFGAVAPRLVGGVAASLPRQVLKAMGQEGGTELVQEYVGNVATKLALEKPDEYGISQDEMWQLADAGVLGGLTGGAMAVPGGSLSRAGQGVDMAVDAAGAVINRFRPPNDGDGAAAAGVPPPGGPGAPSAGGRLGMALRGLIDADPEVIKKAAGEQFDALMQNEYVQRGIQEGKDFLGELRQSSRLQKLDAFEQQVAAGFKQFTDAFGERAQTDNIEAAYARYKEMLARSGIDFSKVDAAKAGNAAGAAVAGFNEWLGRTEAAANSIFSGFKEGFTNPGENRTTFGPEGSSYEAAAAAGDAVNAAYEFTKSATETVSRYAKAGAKAGAAGFRAMAEAMRKDVGPIEGEAYEADDIAGLLERPARGKQSVVASKDAQLIADTFRQLGVKDSDTANFIGRRLAPLVNDRQQFDAFMSSQATIEAFKNNLGLYPHQVAALLYLNLRENGMDTEAESLGYMGMAPAESTLNEMYGKQPDETVDDAGGQMMAEDRIDEFDDTGVSEVETQPIEEAKAEAAENDRMGSLQNKALAPGEAAKAAFERMQAGTFRGSQGSKRWVIKTRTVRDPATGAVLEQTDEPVQINMMDVGMAESGARSARKGETKQQRKDADWMAGVASMFNGWQETDEEGRTVEVTVRPGTQTSTVGPDGKKVNTAVPSDVPLNEWIRPREEVGANGRTFATLEKENRANKPPSNFPTAVESYIDNVKQAKEAGVEDTTAYDEQLIRSAVNDARDARFPQDLRMASTADLKEYEAEVSYWIDWVDQEGKLKPIPALDGMWALLRNPAMPPQVTEQLLGLLGRAISADNVDLLLLPEGGPPPEQLRAMRRELFATPPAERSTESFVQRAQDYARGVADAVAQAISQDEGVLPASLRLLPSDVLLKRDAQDRLLLTRMLFGAIRNSEAIRNDDSSITDNPTQPAPDQEIYGREAYSEGTLQRDNPKRVELMNDERQATRGAPRTKSMASGQGRGITTGTEGDDFQRTGEFRQGRVRDQESPGDLVDQMQGVQPAAVPINTISGKGGTRMYDADLKTDANGALKEDLSGNLIDHGSAVDRELREKAIRRKEEERRKSVVKATREAAKGRRGDAVSTLPEDQGEMDFGGTLASQNAEDFFDDDQIAEMRARSAVRATREAAKKAPAGMDPDFDVANASMEELRAASQAYQAFVDGGGTPTKQQAAKWMQINDQFRQLKAAAGGAAKGPKGQAGPSGSVRSFADLPAHQPGQRTMTYAGVGSRETPPEMLATMRKVAAELARAGYTLRSGGAIGADKAFEAGAGKKEIFYAKDATPTTIAIAREIHPAPNALGEFPLKLMARNTNQVFGRNLDSPVDFVLAWTKDGAESAKQRTRSTGGTGQAIAMASMKGVPVINLANEGWQTRLREILNAGNPPALGKAVGGPTGAFNVDRVPQEVVYDRIDKMAAVANRLKQAPHYPWSKMPYTADDIDELAGLITGMAIDGSDMPTMFAVLEILDVIRPSQDDVNAFLKPLVPLTDEEIDTLGSRIQDLLGTSVKGFIEPVLISPPSSQANGLVATGGMSGVNVFSPAHKQEIIGVATILAGLSEDPFTEAQQTVYHEAMHAVIGSLVIDMGAEAIRPLIEAAQQPHIQDQVLDAALNDDQRAYYASNPEEMLVQAYALWATGKLKLNAEPRLEGFFNQIKALVQRIFQILKGDELLAEAFASVSRGDMRNRTKPTKKQWVDSVAARGNAGYLNYLGKSGTNKEVFRAPLQRQLEKSLAEAGFALEQGTPNIDEVGTLIDIARKEVKLSNDPASLKQAAQGLSMLMVGHKDFEALRPEIEQTGAYKRHLEAVKGTQSRADQEAARRVLADLIASNFAKRATIEPSIIDKIKAFASRVWDALANRVAPQLADAVDKMVEKMLNERGYLVQKSKDGYEPVNFQSAIDSDPLAGSILAAAATTPAALTGSLAYATQTRVLRPKNAAIHDLDFKVGTPEEAREFMAKMSRAFPGMRKVNSFKERGGYEVGTMLVPPPGTKFLNLTKNSYYLVDDAGKKVGYFKKMSDGEEGWGQQAKSVDLFIDTKPAASPSVDHTFTQGGKQHTLKIYNVTDGVAAKLRILRPKDIWDYQKYNPRLKHSLYEGEGGLDLTTPEGRDEARRRIREIAGDVGIKFGTENTYDPEGHLITLAVSRFADLGTAYHEALHSIFKAIDANDKETLYRGLNTMHVRNQLRTLLKDSPAALEAALNDPEELAAYAFQFYKRGMLKLGPETATWLDKLVKVIEKVTNWLLDQPGHEELFQKIAEGYYKNGGPSPVELAALRQSKGAARRIVSDTARGLLSVYDKVLGAVDDRLRQAGISELTDIAKQFYTQVGEKGSQRGMAQEIPIMTNLWMNRLAKVLGDDAGVAAAALEEMALGNENSPKAKELRTFLNLMRTYMKQAGVDIGYIEGYLPMQWSGDKIADDEDGFIAMLQKYRKELAAINLSPESAWKMMSQRNISSAIPTGDVFDPDGKPTMWHTQERVFSFLSAEDRRPYVEDNLIGTLGQYVKQAVKRAEWDRRYPGNSWEKALETAAKRGATPEHIAIAKDLKEAVFGAKYNRMDPTWRRALGAVQTYQNVRVLGLSLFSSVADPLAIGVRTGDFKEAWNAFKFGMRHIYKAPQGDLNTLAEDIGVVNELGNLDSLMTLYGGFEVEGNLKHVNDMLFKYNGLEGLTRGLRVYAAGAGVRFIQRANTRQLAELGLKSEDLKYMPDGTLAVRGSQFKELGASNKEATDSALKMQRALNRFVDESVLRPNAAERPKWANDPVFALLFHLKQFIFSFHKIVSKKVMHEIDEGNTEAGMYLSAAAFVPLMAATGYMKDLIQFAGTVPDDRDFMHYLIQGVNRSGFIGPSVLASDVGSDLMSGQNPIGSVGGPAISQALEALQALANPDRFSGFVEEALPLSSIYKRWND